MSRVSWYGPGMHNLHLWDALALSFQLVYKRHHFVHGMRVQFELNGGEPVGTSIPATEHSVMTAWHTEKAAIENMIDQFGDGLFACVMDSYDYAKVWSPAWLSSPSHCSLMQCTRIRSVLWH